MVSDGPLERRSPQVREEALDAALPAIPIEAIRNFLRGPRLVTLEETERAPYVVAFVDERLAVGANSDIYVRRNALNYQAPATWWAPEPVDINYLFDNIGPCPLRYLVVDMWICLCLDTQSWMGDDAEQFHHQFLFEVCKKTVVKHQMDRRYLCEAIGKGTYREKEV